MLMPVVRATHFADIRHTGAVQVSQTVYDVREEGLEHFFLCSCSVPSPYKHMHNTIGFSHGVLVSEGSLGSKETGQKVVGWYTDTGTCSSVLR